MPSRRVGPSLLCVCALVAPAHAGDRDLTPYTRKRLFGFDAIKWVRE